MAAVFTVTRESATSATVLVDYTTIDGTATAGADYAAQSGTLVFEPGGGSTRTISIAVIGDTLPEADETFAVELRNARGAGLRDNRGTGTILNDDSSPGADPTCALSAQQVQQGGAVIASCVGLRPNSEASATLESTPRPLGTFRVNGSGVLTATLTIPADAEPGPHTIVISGTANAGNPQIVRLPLTITAAQRGGPQPGGGSAPAGGNTNSPLSNSPVLPRTGASIALLVVTGLGLILLGLRLQRISRDGRTASADPLDVESDFALWRESL